MTPELQRLINAVKKAANRLHHISFFYAGAMYELVHGKQVAFVKDGTPGLSTTRDLVDLILFCRAEINGMTKLLIDKGIITQEEYHERVAEEYEYFAQAKARHFGASESSDAGLVFKKEDLKKDIRKDAN